LTLTVALLGLNLLHDRSDLFGFSAKPRQQLLTRLLSTTKAAEADVVGMLLPAGDAESHALRSA